MSIIKPTPKSNKRIVNPPEQTQDSSGKPGTGGMQRQSNMKNKMSVEPPSKGDNSAWSKAGKKLKGY